jgi:hypothetical protein
VTSELLALGVMAWVVPREVAAGGPVREELVELLLLLELRGMRPPLRPPPPAAGVDSPEVGVDGPALVVVPLGTDDLGPIANHNIPK